MSGHSKWSQIKHKKALTDAKKGKLFSKMARLITVATRTKGKDMETNPALRTIIDKAHSLNMPIDNIERAVARGAGELEDAQIEELILEAYGPAGSAMIIEGATDNRNRSVAEIKFLLSENNGKLADPGSVLWLFERFGFVNIKIAAGQNKQKDELELAAIESGAQDIKWLNENTMEIFTHSAELEKTRKNLEEKNIRAEDFSLVWRPKNYITVNDPRNKEQLEKLLEAIGEHDDVNEIYVNADI